MCPDYLSIRRQRGIGLPAAIFIIVLMAGIAVAINQLLSQNAQTFEEEINLTRAFYAAESGAGIAIDPMTGDVWIAEFWRKRIGRLRRLADMDDSGG